MLKGVSVSIIKQSGESIEGFVTNNNGEVDIMTDEKAFFPFNFKLSAQKPGFADYSENVVIKNKDDLVTIYLSPELHTHKNYRAVLSWGSEPMDLDLYVNEYTDDETCVANYISSCVGPSSPNDHRGGLNAVESMTWGSQTPSTYLIYVVIHSKDSYLRNSQVYSFCAKLNILYGGGAIGSGLWKVVSFVMNYIKPC